MGRRPARVDCPSALDFVKTALRLGQRDPLQGRVHTASLQAQLSQLLRDMRA